MIQPIFFFFFFFFFSHEYDLYKQINENYDLYKHLNENYDWLWKKAYNTKDKFWEANLILKILLFVKLIDHLRHV